MKETTLLFLVREGEILLAMKKRGFGEGRWNGIGGKVEPNESVEDAMIRETKEEIDVTPTAYSKVADMSFDQFFKGEPFQMHLHVFFATEWEGEPAESDEMKPEWFPQSSLPYESMWPDDPFWLPLVLEGKKIRASFVINEHDTVTEHTITRVKDF